MNLIERMQNLPVLELLLPPAPATGPGAGQSGSGGSIPVLRYRQAGALAAGAPVMVLLHGIGSGSGSWVNQLEAANAAKSSPQALRLLAWDAPGYGGSTALGNSLADSAPSAADYAHRLWQWLDAVGGARGQPVHLVGHSLGCIMAAAAARLQPARTTAITLLAPALGYGNAPEAMRMQKQDERLQLLAQLGPLKLAQLRGPALLAAGADAQQVALAVHLMAGIETLGYTQATQMLSGANIQADLQALVSHPAFGGKVQIACGELDAITPPKGSQLLVAALQALARPAVQVADYASLGSVGHLCAVQAAQAVSALLGLGAETGQSP